MGEAKVFLLLPYRAVLGILLAGGKNGKQGMCPLILSAGIVSVLENVSCGAIFVGNLDEREGAAVGEAVTEVSVFSHGRVEDGEVWTSLKKK